MNWKHLIFAFIILSVVLLFCGCNGNNGNNSNEEDMQRLVGTWNTSEPIQWFIKPSFTFYENQSFVVGLSDGYYYIENDTLVLEWDDEHDTVFVYDYEFIDNDTLRLTYIQTGDEGVYKRQ